MVHWKRDLDLYTIGRPLERNAGFWLNYMKGLKGDHGDTTPTRSEPVIPAAPLPVRTPPRAAGPAAAAKDPLSDPFFTAPDPLDDVNLPMAPAYDDVRGIIDRARRRHRDLRADADKRAARF
ncbi:uncharacterized protein LOC119114573 isoform X1 [Pollicipes pollicipes]|uniref:uncharacterized protein LOC119114573 isoform X1 n=1 Tax=Pollicipes pollicipes TaxID=41117 RepID=UPI001884D1A2|nr:uncharacterized protein LOC119114573 isoform X1 [Pollicipes pollicipes]